MKAKYSVEKRIEYKVNKTEHIQNYDYDNCYPQRVIDILNNSVTTTTCLRIRRKFLIGGGFFDKDFYNSIVNRVGLTADKLLRKSINDFSIFDSLAIHVNYNGLGKIIEANFVPFDNCRLTDCEDADYRNKIAVYPDWSKIKKKQIKTSDIEFYNKFDPSKVLEEVESLNEYDNDGNLIISGWAKYKGQILWYSPIDEYPLAYFDVVLENMEAEGEFKNFYRSNVKNNFIASHIMSVGKFENDGDREQFYNNIKGFQGSNGNAVLILEKESDEDKIELDKVDIQDYDGAWEKTETSCEKSIRKTFLIPPALFLETSASFTDDEIEVATNYYNSITYDERLILEEIFEKIFSNWHTNINPSGDYSIIPKQSEKSNKQIDPAYFPYYSKNEIREANGDEPVNESDANIKILADTLGVAGTQALTSILIDPVMSYSQKLGVLQVLFSLSEADSIKMLGENQNKIIR